MTHGYIYDDYLPFASISTPIYIPSIEISHINGNKVYISAISHELPSGEHKHQFDYYANKFYNNFIIQ